MPLSKIDIDPETAEVIRAAFHRVCDVLQIDGSEEDPIAEVVGAKIVELAKAGELDPELLFMSALAALEASALAMSLPCPG